MGRLWVGALWLGVAGALIGCSSQPLSGEPASGGSEAGAPEGGAPEGGASATLEQACGDLQQAACADFQRCAPEIFGSRYPDLATCVSVRTSACIERRSAPGNTVTPDQIEDCAHATSNPTCNEVVASEYGINPVRVPACVWTGTFPDGEECFTSSQCASGSCSFYERDSCGTCVTRDDDTECLTSNECLLGSFCINGQCIVARTEGQACGSLAPCALGLACQAGACVELGQAGEPCTTPDTGGCAPNLWCNEQSGLCEHSTLGTGQGECGLTRAGGNTLCPAGKACLPDASTRTDHCVPAGAEGALCSYDIQCGVGLECQESTCAKLRADVCVPSITVANPTYPASLPSVPQGVAPVEATVLATPKIVLITFDGDARASALEGFVSALGSSEYWHHVTSEYGVGKLKALPSIRVNETPPVTLPDSGVRTWLSDKIATDPRFPASDALTLYAVAYPHGVTVSLPGAQSGASESCRDFGGYHDALLSADGTPTPYVVIPDCFYVDPNEALSHEAVEAATDPFANLAFTSASVTRGYATVDVPHFAWSLPAGGGAELADLCEWQPLIVYRDPQVAGMVQRSWSNASMAGFHQPCVPARAGSVYFNGVPHFDDLVSVQLPDAPPVRTRGIAIPLGQSRTVPVDMLSDAPMDGPWRVSAYDLKEWNNEFNYTAGTEPTLGFSFDKQTGLNGDTLQMTIKVLKQDSDYQAEPFVLVSRRGRTTNLWVGVVGQP